VRQRRRHAFASRSCASSSMSCATASLSRSLLHSSSCVEMWPTTAAMSPRSSISLAEGVSVAQRRPLHREHRRQLRDAPALDDDASEVPFKRVHHVGGGVTYAPQHLQSAARQHIHTEGLRAPATL
jgi:hypothetical protein